MQHAIDIAHAAAMNLVLDQSIVARLALCITRTEVDANAGEEEEREIPFIRDYSVFNVEQVEGQPTCSCATAEPQHSKAGNHRVQQARSSVSAILLLD